MNKMRLQPKKAPLFLSLSCKKKKYRMIGHCCNIKHQTQILTHCIVCHTIVCHMMCDVYTISLSRRKGTKLGRDSWETRDDDPDLRWRWLKVKKTATSFNWIQTAKWRLCPKKRKKEKLWHTKQKRLKVGPCLLNSVGTQWSSLEVLVGMELQGHIPENMWTGSMAVSAKGVLCV